MITLIDHIRLKSPEHREAFVRWVREVDYLACQDLPSVQAFMVHECLGEERCEFFEVVQICSLEAFEKDMQTALFQSLVSRFHEMATLTESFSGRAIEPGFIRPPSCQADR